MRARHKTYWPTDKNYWNNNKTNKNYLTGDVESMSLAHKPGQTMNCILKGKRTIGGPILRWWNQTIQQEDGTGLKALIVLVHEDGEHEHDHITILHSNGTGHGICRVLSSGF
jgi:hypothetical protein